MPGRDSFSKREKKSATSFVGVAPRKSSSRKYACPCCGLSVRATKVVNIACMDCDEQLLLVG